MVYGLLECEDVKMKRMKRAAVFLIAAAMFVSLGFVPGGESSASGKLLSAKIPAKYSSGYDIYRAIDISAHQGGLSVNQFRQIKALGITHVIIRSSYTRLAYFGLKPDKCFKTNINNAHAAGLKVGVYHYSQAKTTKEAQKEAAYTLRQIAPYKSKITLPVVFDYEFGVRLNGRYAKKQGRTKMTNIAIAYCEAVRRAGYTPMVYANASMLNSYVNRDTLHAKYPIWLAHYTRKGKATDYSKEIAMWQYSSSGRLTNARTGKAIVKGRIDMDYLFVKKGTRSSWSPKPAKAKAKATAPSGKFVVKTKCKLNVRKGPAKTYKKVRTLKKGKKVTIVKTKNGWGKIKNKQWINLEYTNRVK